MFNKSLKVLTSVLNDKIFASSLVGAFSVVAAFCVSSAFMACSEEQNDIAGGVSEENNTLAGILVNHEGDVARGVCVSARFLQNDTLVLTDTTDDEGRFGLPLSRTGRYGLSAQVDSSAYYEIVNYEGEEIEVEAKLAKTGDIYGVMNLRPDTNAANVLVFIPGSEWRTETDENGYFEFKDVPQGSVPVVAFSPDPMHYVDVGYMAQVSDGSVHFLGPVPMDRNFDFVVGDFRDASDVDSDSSNEKIEELQFPISREYGLRSWFSMDYLTTSGKVRTVGDARGWTEGLLVYGAELDESFSGRSLALNGASQYAVVENDRGLLDSVSEFTFETWVQIDSVLSDEKSYRKNVVGKLGFGSESDRDVFSFALVKGECGVGSGNGPRFAFFLADGLGDSLSCDNAVFAANDIKYGTWVYVAAVWNGSTLSLYLDGSLEASKAVTVEKIDVSSEPIFFGKEAINLKLDDVRFSVKAITGSDAEFRYHLKGGAL